MAANVFLRRVSPSLLHVTSRSARRTMSFVSSTSSISVSDGRRWDVSSSRPHFLVVSPLSTSTPTKPTADENLLRVLKNEISCAEQPSEVEDKPEGFAFEIEDNPGERMIHLQRKFQDELIKVEVEMPSSNEDDNPGKDDDDEEDDAAREPNESGVSCLPLVVSITKGNSMVLEFGITGFPDEFTIDSLSIKNTAEGSEDQLAYEGPDFSDLDENLQKAFHKYLEIRGIKASTTNFLFEYMANKDNKEYLLWLENLANFLQK